MAGELEGALVNMVPMNVCPPKRVPDAFTAP